MNTLNLTRAGCLSLGMLFSCGDSSEATGGGGAGATGAGATGAGAAGAGGESPQGGGGSGGATATCSPYDDESCEAGKVCTVADEALGLDGGMACTDAGPNAIGAACTQVTDCVGGAHCDRVTGTCKGFCEGLTDCESGDCLEATSQAGLEIPGIKVCRIDCNPQTAEGCDSAAGDVSCVFRPDIVGVDCFIAGDGQLNGPCTLDADCGVTLGCIDGGAGGLCEPWCTESAGNVCDHPTAVIGICVPRIPAVEVDGVIYGGCYPG